MKTTRLIAVLTGLATIGIVAADASAMYHATLGRFLQRDPGVGAGSPARVGSAGAAVGGGFIERDPTGSNQYADGMNLYQYVKSSPGGHLDPTGLRAKTWFACGAKNLYIETDWCCAPDPKTVQRAVCSAYKTLKAVADALWDHEYTRPWTAAHDHTHTQFNRYFYGRQKGKTPNSVVEEIRDIYVDLIDELDDPDGTHYRCDGKQGKCSSGAVAVAGPWTTHLCHGFFWGTNATDKFRAGVIIHELSHMYQDTTDHGLTYVTSKNAAGAPVYTKYTKTEHGYVPEPGPASLSATQRFVHADTLSEFALEWYVP